MYQLTMQSNAAENAYKLQEINVNADIAEGQALYAASKMELTGSKIVDGICALFNYSVRPVLTYLFFVFYGIAKYAQYTMIKTASTTALTTWQAIDKLYGSEDMALFATVVAFWFGQRSLRYAMGQLGNDKTPMAFQGVTAPSVPETSMSTPSTPLAFK